MTDKEIKSFARRVRRLLKSIEWSGDSCELDYDWEENPIEEHYPCCPSCGGINYHDENCKLIALANEATVIIKG